MLCIQATALLLCDAEAGLRWQGIAFEATSVGTQHQRPINAARYTYTATRQSEAPARYARSRRWPGSRASLPIPSARCSPACKTATSQGTARHMITCAHCGSSSACSRRVRDTMAGAQFAARQRTQHPYPPTASYNRSPKQSHQDRSTHWKTFLDEERIKGALSSSYLWMCWSRFVLRTHAVCLGSGLSISTNDCLIVDSCARYLALEHSPLAIGDVSHGLGLHAAPLLASLWRSQEHTVEQPRTGV